VRVRYFGHACVLVETAVLTDPFVSYDYPAEVPRYTLADLPDQIDYALITHAHSDHLEYYRLCCGYGRGSNTSSCRGARAGVANRRYLGLSLAAWHLLHWPIIACFVKILGPSEFLGRVQ
jgi:hypothetical protein